MYFWPFSTISVPWHRHIWLHCKFVYVNKCAVTKAYVIGFRNFNIKTSNGLLLMSWAKVRARCLDSHVYLCKRVQSLDCQVYMCKTESLLLQVYTEFLTPRCIQHLRDWTPRCMHLLRVSRSLDCWLHTKLKSLGSPKYATSHRLDS